MNHWKVYCMEDAHPGLWQRWFRHQCVTAGWKAEWGYPLTGATTDRGWARTRNALREMAAGDRVVVHLKGNRIGRVGEIVRLRIDDDQWDPLVPPNRDLPDGEMGRRVMVRWDLTIGPGDVDMLVELPVGFRFSTGVSRPTACRLPARTFDSIVKCMWDASNWVRLGSHFEQERSLSDYIRTNPHRLEDGIEPYPDAKVREHVFKNGTRSDVLLLDRDDAPVVVECKQGGATISHLRQLSNYMKLLTEKTGSSKVRGILVHGGARKLRADVLKALRRYPRIEIVRYDLSVGFAPCGG